MRSGDVLIAVSVLLLLVGFGTLWNRDYLRAEKEHADRIRRSAAVVSAKVERWPDLEDRFFEDLEPIIVDVSEKVAQSHATEPANRILYKGIHEAKGRSSQRWLDEQLELSYADLDAELPELRPIFRQTLGALKRAEDKMYGELSISLQAALRDEAVLKLEDSPEIGNVLRKKATEQRSAFLAEVPDVSKPFLEQMKFIIEMSKNDLLDANTRTLVPHDRQSVQPVKAN